MQKSAADEFKTKRGTEMAIKNRPGRTERESRIYDYYWRCSGEVNAEYKQQFRSSSLARAASPPFSVSGRCDST